MIKELRRKITAKIARPQDIVMILPISTEAFFVRAVGFGEVRPNKSIFLICENCVKFRSTKAGKQSFHETCKCITDVKSSASNAQTLDELS